MNLNKNKKAFTLIELLIVIAIIGILFIVLVSKVDFATDKAKATGVQTDFRSFQVALDTVAKENAGFNTFGYNTGDNAGAIPNGYAFESTEAENKTKGDGIRNSYDQGDKNLNGKQDVNGVDGYTGTTEVFTGRKIYTETWTEVYTLVKPGTTGLDATAVFALETAINKNLDPKLHITIAADGKITMANQARDPWKNEYHGVYISQAERDGGADRGAIIMYSNGANGNWGSAHDITNGVVTVTVPGNNVNGKDDYSLVSCYTFVNGYGEVLNMSTGFSNNQSFNGNASNTPTVVPGHGSGNNGGQTPSEPSVQVLEPGYYNVSGELVMKFDELKSTYGFDVELSTTEYEVDNGWGGFYNLVQNNPELQGITKIVFPQTITKIGSAQFHTCSFITEVEIPEGVEYIGMQAFYATGLNTITLPKSLRTLDDDFAFCVTKIIYKGNLLEWNNIEKYGMSISELNARGITFECEPMATGDNLAGGYNSNGEIVYSYDELVAMYNFDVQSDDATQSFATIVSNNNLQSITKLVLPEGITIIGRNQFANCTSLTELVLPKTIQYIEESAFRYGTTIQITFNGTGKEWFTAMENSWNYTLSNLSNATFVFLENEDFSNQTFATDAPGCYDRNGNLIMSYEELQVNYGWSVEMGCSEYGIDRGYLSMYNLMIVEPKLANTTTIILPSNITGIGSAAFYGCSNLETIVTPVISNIYMETFYGCSSLTTIKFNGTIEQWNNVDIYEQYFCSSEVTIVCTNGTIVHSFN